MYLFITIGYDCSPASALRGLGLRTAALPFDWIESNITSLEKCLGDRFSQFYKNVHLNETKTRVIDAYGFQFPHDYPTTDENKGEIGECDFGESGKKIVENWMDFYDIAKAKYERRIERFLAILSDTRPLLVLCRYSSADVLRLERLLIKTFDKKNIYFVNACQDAFETSNIINIHPDIETWNDTEIWKQGIQYIIQKMSVKKGYNFLAQLYR